MKPYIKSLIPISILFFSLHSFAKKQESLTNNKPNIIIFFADDLGWMDLGCYGSKYYETPNIDILSGQGVRFTNAYSAHPVCGPTRTALLSGQSPIRLNNYKVNGDLKAEHITIAESLKELGYATYFCGKWHMGTNKGRHPVEQGFDTAIGWNHAGQTGSYFYPYKDEGIEIVLNRKRKLIPKRDIIGFEDGEDGEFLTDRLTQETVKWITKNKDQPFFIYFSHYSVHTPLQAKEEYVRYFEEKNKKLNLSTEAIYDTTTKGVYCRKNQSNAIFAANLKSLDDSMGELMACLKKNKLAENTIIIFASDNGGYSCSKVPRKLTPTSNFPLNKGKGWMYEGGIKVPTIIKYSGALAPGATSDVLVCTYDFYPSILEMVKSPLKPEQHKDGVSILKGLKNKDVTNSRSLFWFHPYPNSAGHRPSAAIRKDYRKLIWFLETDNIVLYDLEHDIEEKNDLAALHAATAKEMQQELENWIIENNIDLSQFQKK